MRSALYYPHTRISSVGLIKTALLLWDRLEYIVPWKDFSTEYSDFKVAEAMEVVGKPHCPTAEEKRKAHLRLEELVNGQLPLQFYLPAGRSRGRSGDEDETYEMYPGKLLPESWKILQNARLAGTSRGSHRDYPLTEYAGLTIMSIVADCCAGTTRSRVTDRGDAYATVAGLLGNSPGSPQIDKADAYNGAAGEQKLSDSVANAVFEKWWPDLEAQISKVTAAHKASRSTKDVRSDRDLIEELLLLTRKLSEAEANKTGTEVKPPLAPASGVKYDSSLYKDLVALAKEFFNFGGYDQAELVELKKLVDELNLRVPKRLFNPLLRKGLVGDLSGLSSEINDFIKGEAE